jgi:hypothetical protein
VTTRSPPIFFASIVLLLFRLDLCALESAERSVSPSGQFVIYGADPAFRGAISDLAERTKVNLLRLLQRRDNWKIAVIVSLRLRAADLPEIPATEFRFSETETGLKLQLDLGISGETNPYVIEHELARVMLLEMIYRNQTGIAAGDVYVDPPNWLIDGLLGFMPNRYFALRAAAQSMPERVPSLDEFLRERPEVLDSAARQLYRVYSFVLVRLLIESPDGRSRLGRYVENLAFGSNDPMADLQAAFPGVSDFHKAWKSKIADVKITADRGLLAFSQTAAKLTEILRARFPAAGGREKLALLDDFSRIKPSVAQRLALQKLGQELMLLETRANPVLRPVIADYQRIADCLALGRTREIGKRLAELESLRTRLSARMGAIEDYMNWFEAAKLETPSGMFGDYLRVADGIDSQKPKRRDPLSVYLDAMELEF